MTKFALDSSMADRISFDEAVKRYLDEWLAVTGGDANLLPATIDGLREQFLTGLDVDNMEAAEARFNRIIGSAEFAAAVAAATRRS
jgi:hypothetical protein